MKTQRPHKCLESEFRYICPHDPEWEACLCTDEDVKKAVKFMESVEIKWENECPDCTPEDTCDYCWDKYLRSLEK